MEYKNLTTTLNEYEHNYKIKGLIVSHSISHSYYCFYHNGLYDVYSIKGDVVLSPFICIALVTYFLIVSAELINESVAGAIGTAFGVGLGTAALFYFFCSEKYGFKIDAEREDIIAILFIYGWTLSVFMWTCNLFKKQRDVANTDNANNKTDYNNDLIGGWYGVDSKLSCFLPVLAFEKITL